MTLNGTNFKKWKQDLKIVLGLIDLDLALREDEPPKPIDDSSVDVKSKFEKWEKANHICLLIMKRSMSDTNTPFVVEFLIAKLRNNS